MRHETIKEIVYEIDSLVTGRVLSKVFQLSSFSFAFDFRSSESLLLFMSAEPALPRLYFISRRRRDLEKQSQPLSSFGQAARSNLGGGKLTSVRQDEAERIIRFSFLRQEETGDVHERFLVVQLTGRSANLFLLNDQGIITHALRSLKGNSQQIGEPYKPPSRKAEAVMEPPLEKGSFPTVSSAADAYYQRIETERAFEAQANAAQASLRQDIARLTKLEQRLKNDLAERGDAEQHKRLGNLLLANIAIAERQGNQTLIKDFYAENAPTIAVEIDEHTTLQEEAAKYFGRYAKAKRAARQIAGRLEAIATKLIQLQRQQNLLETIIAERDEEALASFTDERKDRPKTPNRSGKEKSSEKIPGARRYLSSDGYEILVGRAAKDNDHLTFRVARPHDLWLHAADYPGSHVIVRNTTRKEFPHSTVIEAAQLAAKFSQASNDPKVDVHYTQRKFISKIKGAAPGLVRLSSFRTIAVVPKESGQRL
jgi:predicted ribosome quality control (RQC) complex YloA/Tae2 family protein